MNNPWGRTSRRWAKLLRDPAGFALDLPNPYYRAMLRMDLIVVMTLCDLLDLRSLLSGFAWRVGFRDGPFWPKRMLVRSPRSAGVIASGPDGTILAGDVATPAKPVVFESAYRPVKVRTYSLDGQVAPQVQLRPISALGVVSLAIAEGASLDEGLRRAWPGRPLSTPRPRRKDLEAWLSEAARAPLPPESPLLISIVMPVRDPSPAHLNAALASILAQNHRAWQLCIADDGSRSEAVRRRLAQVAGDRRVALVTHRTSRGISSATNSALDLVRGEAVVFMDHDDVLTPDALWRVASAFDDPSVMAVYSDEAVIDGSGRFRFATLKPSFDLERVRAQNYVNHLFATRAEAVRRVGGLDPQFDGAQDHDLILRLSEQFPPDAIRHIPAVLYCWRRVRGGRSFSQISGMRAEAARRRLVEAHLVRAEVPARVERGPLGFNRLRWPLERWPAVSVIIPSRDRPDLLRACIAGLTCHTDYPELEVLVVDNGSERPETLDLLSRLEQTPAVRILSCPGPFNHSRLNNLGVAATGAPVLALLNDDILVSDPDWLREMVSLAVRSDIGAVGAKLLYPDGRIQHAGVVMGLGPHGIAGHELRGFAGDAAGPQYRLVTARRVSAVTAACLVVERQKFGAVGGFDEVTFPIAFNDVDLCLRLEQAGFGSIWTPHARLVHRESASRGKSLDSAFLDAVKQMRRRWPEALGDDAFSHPQFSRKDETLSMSPARPELPRLR
jgi:GT2 family glycosyltransferase